MSTAPLETKIQTVAQAIATAGNTATEIVGEAPHGATVTEVTYTPKAALSGAATNSRTLNLYNRGLAGVGTILVATLALVSGVNLVDNDEKTITLSGTAANLVLVDGDVLEWESLAVGAGIADPGGLVRVTLSRTAV